MLKLQIAMLVEGIDCLFELPECTANYGYAFTVFNLYYSFTMGGMHKLRDSLKFKGIP